MQDPPRLAGMLQIQLALRVPQTMSCSQCECPAYARWRTRKRPSVAHRWTIARLWSKPWICWSHPPLAPILSVSFFPDLTFQFWWFLLLGKSKNQLVMGQNDHGSSKNTMVNFEGWSFWPNKKQVAKPGNQRLQTGVLGLTQLERPGPHGVITDSFQLSMVEGLPQVRWMFYFIENPNLNWMIAWKS